MLGDRKVGEAFTPTGDFLVEGNQVRMAFAFGFSKEDYQKVQTTVCRFQATSHHELKRSERSLPVASRSPFGHASRCSEKLVQAADFGVAINLWSLNNFHPLSVASSHVTSRKVGHASHKGSPEGWESQQDAQGWTTGHSLPTGTRLASAPGRGPLLPGQLFRRGGGEAYLLASRRRKSLAW